MITASVVTYHTKREDLCRLIECVEKSCINKLYIIDHTPGKGDSEIQKLSNKIKYIKHDNLGYGSGNNVAIREAIKINSDYHAVLNPDVYWSDNVVEELSDYMNQNPSCGLVMPKVLYPNGNLQYLCKLVPTPFDLLLRRFIPIRSWQDKRDVKYEMQWTNYDKIMEVPILSGCFMMIRCDVLKKIGGFDERYFMYAEDVDLCRRIGEVSKTIFYPNVAIYHEYAKGSYGSRKMLMMHIRSIIKYFNKWGWIFDNKRKARNSYCTEQIKKSVLQ